jgi:hypothetical protein
MDKKRNELESAGMEALAAEIKVLYPHFSE